MLIMRYDFIMFLAEQGDRMAPSALLNSLRLAKMKTPVVKGQYGDNFYEGIETKYFAYVPRLLRKTGSVSISPGAFRRNSWTICSARSRLPVSNSAFARSYSAG